MHNYTLKNSYYDHECMIAGCDNKQCASSFIGKNIIRRCYYHWLEYYINKIKN